MTTKKLIELLKNPACADCPHNKFCNEMTSFDPCLLFAAAAEALEELEKMKQATADCVKIGKRSYIFKCTACEKTYPYATRCCPSCGAVFTRTEE